MNKSTFAKEFKENRKNQNTGKQAQRHQAQEFFWEYCKYKNPKFFKEDRPHLKKIAETLQAIYEGRIYKTSLIQSEWSIALSLEEMQEVLKNTPQAIICKKIMLNVPPRHGKSYTVSEFVQWALGKNQENRIIATTYNETLSGRFSANVRDGIDATKVDDNYSIFSDVFPNAKIKYGDASKQMWSLEGQFFNYLGTGFGGTITGVGCNIGIIDDPVKNNMEAFNDRILQNQYEWYTDTYLSRIEEGGMQILIMTRWSTKDLCGRLLASSEAGEWYELSLKACINEELGIMLCPSLFSFQSYLKKKGLTSKAIMEANYQQKPVDVQGALYSKNKTYEHLPKDEKDKLLFNSIKAYVDTADTGEDYLCCIVYGVYNLEAYVLDIIYTQESMEKTEKMIADALYYNEVNEADIESNNGGRGFARAVEKILTEKYNTNRCVINWFHQNENKIARIRSAATWVMEHIYFPVNWMHRWSDYYLAMVTYQEKGKNEHDDAPDATTGVAEKISVKKKKWLF